MISTWARELLCRPSARRETEFALVRALPKPHFGSEEGMMRRDPFYYFIVQSVRLLLLPFPITFFFTEGTDTELRGVCAHL